MQCLLFSPICLTRFHDNKNGFTLQRVSRANNIKY